MTNQLEVLSKNMNAYIKALDENSVNRKIWHERTRPLLSEYLSIVATQFQNGLESQYINDITNNEAVNLTFSNSPSQYQSKTEKGFVNYAKVGGALVFNLLYTGHVAVNIMFPYIENLQTKPASLNIEKSIAPSKINESFIAIQVERFLDEMVKWEKGTEINNIGFLSQRN